MSDFKQYPPQTGPYTIKATGGDWQSYDTVRLEISVGYPYHEGDKLKSTLEWASTRFEKTVVLVNDTLQRYNFMFEDGLSEEDAFARAQHEGTKWIARYSKELATTGADIYRWEDWRHHPDYRHDSRLARRIYHSNKLFNQALNSAIEETWQRRVGIHPAYRPSRKAEFFTLSRKYLIEETGVFSLIFRTIPGISAYPGSFHEMWAMFLNSNDPDIPPGLRDAHYIRLKFRKHTSKARLPLQRAA